MAGMSEDDKAKVVKAAKELMTNANVDTRKYDDMAKLAAADKDVAKLVKTANDAYKAYHKAGRALFDHVTDNKWKAK